MSDIFISYNENDRLKIKTLAKALEELGWSVWWDRSIQPGQSFDEIINEKIEEAKCMIVIWSKNSIKSEWVREEASQHKSSKSLLPVIIDNVDPPLGFRLIQTADLINWEAGIEHPGFVSLINAIEKIAGPPRETNVKGRESERQIEIKENVFKQQNNESLLSPSISKYPYPSEVASRFLWDSHVLTHRFRNICFRGFRPLYNKLEKKHFSLKFSEIHSDIDNIFEKVCDILTFKVREFFVNYLSLHKNYAVDNVSVRIHTITPTADVVGLLKNRDKDKKYSEQKLWVTLAWMDQTSYNSKVRTEKWKETYEISSHTAWLQLLMNVEDFFACYNVNNNDEYVNEEEDWRSQYNAIISVPIKFKDLRTNEPPIIYGFLSITFLNKDNHDVFEDLDCYHIAKHGADILSLYYLILEFVLGPIGKI
ncbi:MAG: toll/interleukin-1 receptor domain-containing protein [Desulfobacterales bacterium]|nr:toll/interleukin-1 receptor domain-containing protein [Desulfobacterales bacterium]